MNLHTDLTTCLEASPIPAVLSRGSLSNGTIAFVNSQFEALTGFETDDVYGHSSGCLDLDGHFQDHIGLTRVSERQLILTKQGEVLSIYRIQEETTLPDGELANVTYYHQLGSSTFDDQIIQSTPASQLIKLKSTAFQFQVCVELGRFNRAIRKIQVVEASIHRKKRMKELHAQLLK